MRVGELSALTLQDVDLKKKTIHINKTLSFGIGDNRWHIGPAKSSRSERTIMIPKNLCEILAEYISYYKKIYGVTNQTFLFGVDVPIARETIRHRFWDMADLAGLERIRLHDLRHSHASLLANMGCSVTAIARRMGHSEAECFKTYIHLFVSTDVDLVNKIDKVF
jgi:integrase